MDKEPETKTNPLVKQAVVNLNTIIMLFVLGAIAWAGNEVVQTGKSVTAMVAINNERLDASKRLEKKVDDLAGEVNRQRDSLFELRIKLANVTKPPQ